MSNQTIVGADRNLVDRLRAVTSGPLRAWCDDYAGESHYRFAWGVGRAATSYTLPILERARSLIAAAKEATKARDYAKAYNLAHTAYLYLDTISGVGDRVHTHDDWDSSIDLSFGAAKALVAAGDEAVIVDTLGRQSQLPPVIPEGIPFADFGAFRGAWQPFDPDGRSYFDPMRALTEGSNVVDIIYRRHLAPAPRDMGLHRQSCVVRFTVEKGKTRDTLNLLLHPLYQVANLYAQRFDGGTAGREEAHFVPVPRHALGKCVVRAFRNVHSSDPTGSTPCYVGMPFTYPIRDLAGAVKLISRGGSENRHNLLIALRDAGYAIREKASRAKDPVRGVLLDNNYITHIWTPGG